MAPQDMGHYDRLYRDPPDYDGDGWSPNDDIDPDLLEPPSLEDEEPKDFDPELFYDDDREEAPY